MQALFFDLDETILDRSKSLERFLQWQASEQLAAVFTDPKRYISRFLELDDNGTVWKDRVYEILISEFNISGFGVTELLNTYVKEFHQFCVARPYAKEAIEQLVAMGLKIGLISNGISPFQEHNFQALGISHLFDVVIVSDAVGLRKPDPEIFQYACEQVKVTSAASFFVGDNPVADIQGANAAGIYTIFVPGSIHLACASANATCNDFRLLPGIVMQALSAADSF